jgi:Tol biopolymer transport system component
MKRLLFVIALALPSATHAQGNATPALAVVQPTIAPRVTELGTYRDTTIAKSLLPLEAALSPRGNLVAYNTDDDLRIWNVSAGTSTVILKGWSESIDWSPAGDAITFAHQADQGSREFLWIVRLNPSTGAVTGPPQRVSLTPTTAFAPTFSPDGKSIAFPRADAGRRTSLVIVPATGGAERAVASGFNILNQRWTSDGASLYYFASSDSAGSKTLLYRVAATGGTPEFIREVPRGTSPPELTADTRLVAIRELKGTESNARPMMDHSGRMVGTRTSPSDTWIADWSGRPRIAAIREVHPRGLRITDVASGATRVLIDTTTEVGVPAWFPDGRRIGVITRGGGTYSLIVIGVDGSGMRKIPLAALPQFLALLDWNNANLIISPDGRYAAYLGRGRQSLELVDLNSGKQRTLTRSAITVTTPVWRHDSKGIVYTRDGAVFERNSTRGVHEVSLDGVDRLVRAFPFADFPGSAVVPLNETMAVSFGQGATNHTLIPLNDGAPRVVAATTVMGGGQLSPDGKTLVVRLGPAPTRDFKPARRLTFISLADTTKRGVDLPFTDLPTVSMQYHPDGKRVLVAGRNAPAEPVIFYSVPMDGSAPRAITRVDTKEPVSIFRLSPDGRNIVYTFAPAPHVTFVSLDYSEGMQRLLPGGGKR